MGGASSPTSGGAGVFVMARGFISLFLAAHEAEGDGVVAGEELPPGGGGFDGFELGEDQATGGGLQAAADDGEGGGAEFVFGVVDDDHGAVREVADGLVVVFTFFY